MHDISRRLLYYKKKEVQSLIVNSCQNREVGVRFSNRGFGKRPDVLIYENDVFSSVKKGASSFHISEERWSNPLELSTDMRKKDLDELRIGWDLVLDIDCPYWFYSKLTTYLFIQALKEHKITSISCKFSGNKGFHIGVPFEAFPDVVNNVPVKDWFPDGPKRIAMYLLDYIANNIIKVGEKGKVAFGNIHKTTIKEIAKVAEKTEEELSKTVCEKCNSMIKDLEGKKRIEFLCSKCEMRFFKEDGTKILSCPRCKILMEKIQHEYSICKCGSNKYKTIFDPLSIVDVDTILISSRHMYRAPYSLHEKSGLVSVLVNSEKIMQFEKHMADPQALDLSEQNKFLDSENTVKGEATQLIINAFDHEKEATPYERVPDKKTKYDFEEITEAIPKEFFPQCIQKIMEGLEDGKKRSLFVLTNFLTSIGWSHNQAEELLLEWNKNNKPELREQSVKNQVQYHRRKKQKVLPPNCKSYYQEFQVCFPDGLCKRMKNPVQYTKVKSNYKKKKKRARLTDEQKEMRRLHRERLKKQKEITNKNEDKT